MTRSNFEVAFDLIKNLCWAINSQGNIPAIETAAGSLVEFMARYRK